MTTDALNESGATTSDGERRLSFFEPELDPTRCSALSTCDSDDGLNVNIDLRRTRCVGIETTFEAEAPDGNGVRATRTFETNPSAL
jgi:hypothetical protein